MGGGGEEREKKNMQEAGKENNLVKQLNPTQPASPASGPPTTGVLCSVLSLLSQ